MARDELLYIELKSGYSDNGPAWIGRAKSSKSGRTLYFNGRALKHVKGGYGSGNHEDLETGDSYWVSGVKKNGPNRHPQAAMSLIYIDRSAVKEFLQLRGWSSLDTRWYKIVDIEDTLAAEFHGIENGSMQRVSVI